MLTRRQHINGATVLGGLSWAVWMTAMLASFALVLSGHAVSPLGKPLAGAYLLGIAGFLLGIAWMVIAGTVLPYEPGSSRQSGA